MILIISILLLGLRTVFIDDTDEAVLKVLHENAPLSEQESSNDFRSVQDEFRAFFPEILEVTLSVQEINGLQQIITEETLSKDTAIAAIQMPLYWSVQDVINSLYAFDETLYSQIGGLFQRSKAVLERDIDKDKYPTALHNLGGMHHWGVDTNARSIVTLDCPGDLPAALMAIPDYFRSLQLINDFIFQDELFPQIEKIILNTDFPREDY